MYPATAFNHVLTTISVFLFVQLTGYTGWEMTAIARIQERCRVEVHRNMSTWVVPSDPSGTPILPEVIINALCPSDCSGNGTCKDGEGGLYSITYVRHVQWDGLKSLP